MANPLMTGFNQGVDPSDQWNKLTPDDARGPLTVDPQGAALARQFYAIRDSIAGEQAPIWNPNNPVGTETLQSVGMPQPTTYAGPVGQFIDPATGRMTTQGMARMDNPAMGFDTGGIGGMAGHFTAYHGSPHSFDQFDLSKIGTGEGAQAYGHGMYLADAEGVARGYRDKLTPQNTRILRRADIHAAIDATDVHPEVASIARNSVGDPNLPAFLRATAADVDPQYAGQFHQLADKVEAAMKPPGHMYEVQVNADPEHFLDWDKPLSEQHPVVRDALTQIGIAPTMMQVSEGQLRPFEDRIAAALQGTPLESAGRTIAVDASHASGNWDLSAIRDMLDPASRAKWDAALGDLNAATSPNRPEAWAHLTGQDAHRMVTEMQQPGIGEGYQQALGKSTARDVAASQALQQAGIPGIRYLDAGSRGAGEGSRNSVVFDPATMEIIRKYGLAGLMAGGGAAALSGQQGQEQ